MTRSARGPARPARSARPGHPAPAIPGTRALALTFARAFARAATLALGLAALAAAPLSAQSSSAPPTGGGGPSTVIAPPTGPAPPPGRDPGSDRRLPAESPAATRGGRPEILLLGAPEGVAAADTALQAAGAVLLRIRPLPGLGRELRAYDLRRGLDLAAATALAEAAAAPSGTPVRLDPNDVYRYAQAAPPRLYAPALIGAAPGCRLPGRLRVGIIDGPVDPAHPALAGVRLTTLSALLPGDSPVPADHGTAVAALIAGEDAGGALAGFAPGVHLIAVTGFAAEGAGPGADVDRIAGALDALARAGAEVVNMSFAGPPNRVLDLLLADSAARGTILVAAAGNTGGAAQTFPAAADSVISVTAVDAAGRHFRGATTGGHVDFAAPGVDLYVAAPGGGTYATGTSYAAPIVAALAARLAAQGLRDAEAVRAALRRAARDLGAPGRDPETGWGLVTAPGC